ncbi:hypothetical protein BH11VER1_BH11VER1_34760 [soil metagenome]
MLWGFLRCADILPYPPPILSIAEKIFFTVRSSFALGALCWSVLEVKCLAHDAHEVHAANSKSALEASAVFIPPVEGPCHAVIALVPGCNGDARQAFLQSGSLWIEWASVHHVALLGVTMRSKEATAKAGMDYYYPEGGSGDVFLELLRQTDAIEPRLRGAPLYLFGFSGGAHFVHRFAQWKPERVAGFCAYSAGWWQEPSKEVANVPGFILCGYQDDRFDASLGYFQAGRRLGAVWTFARVRHTGHEIPPRATTLVQAWLKNVIETRNTPADPWRGHLYREETVRGWPATVGDEWRGTATAWLPNATFAQDWLTFHQQQSNIPSKP